MDFDFKEKVMIKMVAAGYFEGLTVSMKCGFFTYMLPKWVHRAHLNLLVRFSDKWAYAIMDLADELLEDDEK